MTDLFDAAPVAPLAEALRPKTLDEVVGQAHLLGVGKPIRLAFQSGKPHSMILWGPPGVGKTTLARLTAQAFACEFIALSAVFAGIKDIRSATEQAQHFLTQGKATIVFVDEIHRFNKSQQDALLAAVEKGKITLIGATTENPSFEVNHALLSRCQVYVLQGLSRAELDEVLRRAVQADPDLRQRQIELRETDVLIQLSGGDARKLLNLLELTVNTFADGEPVIISNDRVQNTAQQAVVRYDKSGDQHYDIISAFIKSLRGSDPDAALYWMARMIKGGEDPVFIARRMLILASEDIGNANPNALLLAGECLRTVQAIGMPEARIVLGQTAVYLATSAKSNSTYKAINAALELAEQTAHLSVPLHLRNAPTALMREQGYGVGYQYAHDFPQNFVRQDYLPAELKNTRLYHPADNPLENRDAQRQAERWGRDFLK